MNIQQLAITARMAYIFTKARVFAPTLDRKIALSWKTAKFKKKNQQVLLSMTSHIDN